jgi:hypothetical protein
MGMPITGCHAWDDAYGRDKVILEFSYRQKWTNDF